MKRLKAKLTFESKAKVTEGKKKEKRKRRCAGAHFKLLAREVSKLKNYFKVETDEKESAKRREHRRGQRNNTKRKRREVVVGERIQR